MRTSHVIYGHETPEQASEEWGHLHHLGMLGGTRLSDSSVSTLKVFISYRM